MQKGNQHSGGIIIHLGPRTVKIIKMAESKVRYLKADYSCNQKFKISNRDELRWSVDLTIQECEYRK